VSLYIVQITHQDDFAVYRGATLLFRGTLDACLAYRKDSDAR
jgi:hypothetical protein